MSAIQQIPQNDGEFVGAFQQNVVRVIGNYGKEDDDEYQAKLDAKQQELATLIAENAVTGEYTDEFDARYQRISAEINELKNEQIGIKIEEKAGREIQSKSQGYG